MSEELDQDPSVLPAPSESLFKERRTRNGGSFLMAAMLGLAQALGFENTKERTVQLAEASRNDDLDLRFGDLPPLD